MASLDEVSVAIGRLEAQNAELLRRSSHHEEETAGIKSQLTALTTDMTSVKSDLAEIKPVVRKVQRWEQRAIGVSLLGGIFGGAVVAKVMGWFS